MEPNRFSSTSVGEANQCAVTRAYETVYEHEEQASTVGRELPPKTPLEWLHKKLAEEAHLRPHYPAGENTVYMLVRVSSSNTIKPDILTGIHVYSEQFRHLSTPLPPQTTWSEWIYGPSLYTCRDVKFLPMAGVSIATDGLEAKKGVTGTQIHIEVESHGWTLGVQELLQTRVCQYFERNHKGNMCEVKWIEYGSLGVGKGAYWNDGGLLNVWWEVIKADLSYLKDEGKDSIA